MTQNTLETAYADRNPHPHRQFDRPSPLLADPPSNLHQRGAFSLSRDLDFGQRVLDSPPRGFTTHQRGFTTHQRGFK
jgi:hypothetical protein